MMLFHTVRPPPSLHYCPFQVSAAQFSSGCSKGSDGSLGTAKKRHSFFPVSASCAVTYPR